MNDGSYMSAAIGTFGGAPPTALWQVFQSVLNICSRDVSSGSWFGIRRGQGQQTHKK